MRSLFTIALLAVTSLLVGGQQVNTKAYRNKTAGRVSSGINPRFFNKGYTQQAAVWVPSFVYQPLSFAASSTTHKKQVIRNGKSPVFIERNVSSLKSEAGKSHEEKFFAFLEDSKALTGIENPRGSFKITRIRTDKQGITRIRSVQQYKGIEIYGSESTLHLDSRKERYTGKFHRIDQDVPVTPAFDLTKSLRIVREDLEQLTTYRELHEAEKKLLDYESPEHALVIYGENGKGYALAWEITIRPNLIEEWKYFVNATDGSILKKYNNTQSDGPLTASGLDLNNQSRTFDVLLQDGIYYMYNMSEDMYNTETEEGVIFTLDANNTSTEDLNYQYVTSTTNTWSQKAAISAHYHATLTYEYFLSTFGRNSLNNLGGNIISLVNVTEDDGTSMENAFWNGKAVFYGNGGTHFKPLAGALDVAAHELGHGVVSNTANLEYVGQSGAINESYADIFGAMVDRQDWKIGEDVVRTNYYPSGALRDMADPHNGGTQANDYWQPAHVSEMYLGTQDNGGVHINSSISNHAYYLFATAVGKEKAEQVFYLALTDYLTKTSQFIDLRIAVVQAARDLYGDSSTEVNEANNAFDAVGVQEEEEVDDTQDYEANSGQERILIYNTDPDFTPTLYTSPASGSTFLSLSNTTFYNKISVTDDGSVGVFVSDDHHIRAINIDASNPAEEIISDDPEWDNAAISKDGRLLAAISTYADDNTIFLLDLNSGRDTTFTLYNPTTSQSNTDAGGVLYADAIEFDYSGEYIMYDAVNAISSTSADDITYWDIGFIKVWDNAANGFGNGRITKLFTSLPQNVSVGNPVFSKNSPDVIAFDYEYDDGFDLAYRLYAANLKTGVLNKLLDNSTWGYPSFSKNDDKIAFGVSMATPTGSEEDIYTLPLTSEKIYAAGNPTMLIEYATWPVYYATGERNLGLSPVANFTVDKKTGGYPLAVRYVDLSTNNPTSWQWNFQGGIPAISTLQHPVITYNTPGTYSVTLKATNANGDNTISKTGYIVVENSTAIGDTENRNILFYPNPVDDVLNIFCPENFSVRIYNVEGVLRVAGKNVTTLDLRDLKPGIYFMELETKAGITRHKLVKK
jgi:Zn-dependent metalloprotease/PKD repeat protein